jgi:asparagine synthase (glutamine-hydrolysing)
VCGICGKLRFDKDAEVSPRLIKSMADSISHRGPDDEGFYVRGQIGLGFRRLSIIDLSGGHQPLSNEDGTVWIIFNGEIYNYVELRDWLLTKGHIFRTKSDTEVIVHLYEEMGPNCVDRLRGMFAFAIWDARESSLLLARDRIGIKPVYYSVSETAVVFASEIKAILVDPEIQATIDVPQIDKVLSFNYLPGEDTLLRNVRKLPPGAYMLVKNGSVQIHRYWDLAFEPSELSLAEAEEQLARLLDECVRQHMISDVPVGFLLSGGVDSTAMLGLAQGKTEQALSSFTIGFTDPGVIDERPYAKLAAERYGTDHHELTLSSKEFESLVPKYIWHMEEPVCEPPAIALFCITALARKYVKVLISGEGGDEAFAGYQIYRNMLWLERIKAALGPTKNGIAACLIAMNSVLHSRKIDKYAPLMKLPLEANYFSGTSNRMGFFNENYEQVYSPDFLAVVNKGETFQSVTNYLRSKEINGTVNKMLYVDTKTWLPHDLLLKADKMTMANSIELRVPFLDHKLLEFAASLPDNYKVRRFTTKYIAKRVLRNKVPREILRRKKTGFPVPYVSWLRSDLKGWLRDILLDPRTTGRGYFSTKSIEYLLSANATRGSYSKEVFTLALLELWQREFLESKTDRVLQGDSDPRNGEGVHAKSLYA